MRTCGAIVRFVYPVHLVKITDINFISTQSSRFPPHEHHWESELHYIVEGDGVFINGSKQLRISKGSLVFSLPRTNHSACLDQIGKSLLFFYIRFNGEDDEDQSLLKTIQRRFGAVDLVNVGQGPRASFEDIRRRFHAGDDLARKSAHHLFLSILYELARDGTAFPVVGQSKACLERAVVLMQEAIHAKISSKELAAHLHLSESYFIRLFKLGYGVSPMKYLAGLKMQTAKHLLETTDLPVYLISEQLAYYDEFHFSKAFKEHTGMSPSTYRKGPTMLQATPPK